MSDTITQAVHQYGSLREKIAAEKAKRAPRYEKFETVLAVAKELGLRAGEACAPTGMIVGQAKSLLSTEIDYSKGPMHFVADGACGFAWISIRPATSSFARWLVKNKHARAGVYGGIDISVKEFGQSLQRKEAYANAFADYLREAGIVAYANSRMD